MLILVRAFGKSNKTHQELIDYLNENHLLYEKNRRPLMYKPSFNFLLFAIFICFFISFLGNIKHTVGQVQPNLGQASRLMREALTAMEANDYQTAHTRFSQIIDSNAPIPLEMPYYIAEMLYELKQYDNSANFLHKYLEITGFKGNNYTYAKELEQKLKKPLDEIRACEYCDRRGYRYKTCFTCEGSKEIQQDCSYCKGKGIIGCSRCAGSGLVTKKNVFNIVEYFECERCDGNGRLTCPTCQGTKLEVSACKTCQGSGRLNSEKICDHTAETE